MTTYTVSKTFRPARPFSARALQVCRMFGVTLDRLAAIAPTHACRVEIRPGDLVYITGPSGAGKSVLLRELEHCVPEAASINLAGIDLPPEGAVVDCLGDDVLGSLRLLSMVGLGDVFALLNRPCHLSAGQQQRFRLARALAARRPFVFADEFCSALDRITAAAVAFNVHRLARRRLSPPNTNNAITERFLPRDLFHGHDCGCTELAVGLHHRHQRRRWLLGGDDRIAQGHDTVVPIHKGSAQGNRVSQPTRSTLPGVVKVGLAFRILQVGQQRLAACLL